MSASGLKHPLPDHLRLERVFAACFGAAFGTRLEGGAAEPFYRAAVDEEKAVIFYRADYRSSALHEVAHWCVAGESRRQQDDYGYWYAADGRDLALQQAFEQVELKPQAIELLFTAACGWPFRVSVDNLALPDYDSSAFAAQVLATALQLLVNGELNERAGQFIHALRKVFAAGALLDEVAVLRSIGSTAEQDKAPLAGEEVE